MSEVSLETLVAHARDKGLAPVLIVLLDRAGASVICTEVVPAADYERVSARVLDVLREELGWDIAALERQWISQ